MPSFLSDPQTLSKLVKGFYLVKRCGLCLEMPVEAPGVPVLCQVGF